MLTYPLRFVLATIADGFQPSFSTQHVDTKYKRLHGTKKLFRSVILQEAISEDLNATRSYKAYQSQHFCGCAPSTSGGPSLPTAMAEC